MRYLYNFITYNTTGPDDVSCICIVDWTPPSAVDLENTFNNNHPGHVCLAEGNYSHKGSLYTFDDSFIICELPTGTTLTQARQNFPEYWL